MKEFNLLIWLTQLGLSVAVPPVLCIFGALYLRSRFGLGSWVLMSGLVLGFCFAIGSFRTSLRAMEKMHGTGKQDPPVSYNDHQ